MQLRRPLPSLWSASSRTDGQPAGQARCARHAPRRIGESRRGRVGPQHEKHDRSSAGTGKSPHTDGRDHGEPSPGCRPPAGAGRSRRRSSPPVHSEPQDTRPSPQTDGHTQYVVPQLAITGPRAAPTRPRPTSPPSVRDPRPAADRTEATDDAWSERRHRELRQRAYQPSAVSVTIRRLVNVDAPQADRSRAR